MTDLEKALGHAVSVHGRLTAFQGDVEGHCSAITGLTLGDPGLEKRGVRLIQAETDQIVKVFENYRRRLAEVIEDLDPDALPQGLDQQPLQDALSTMEAAHDKLQGNDGPPEEIADLIRENEPYGEAQERLFQQYKDIGNKIMMDTATSEEMALHSRLHGGLGWINKKAVETL